MSRYFLPYFQQQKASAAKCPVCKGSGRVLPRVGHNTGGKKCHGCDGKGWVKV